MPPHAGLSPQHRGERPRRPRKSECTWGTWGTWTGGRSATLRPRWEARRVWPRWPRAGRVRGARRRAERAPRVGLYLESDARHEAGSRAGPEPGHLVRAASWGRRLPTAKPPARPRSRDGAPPWGPGSKGRPDFRFNTKPGWCCRGSEGPPCALEEPGTLSDRCADPQLAEGPRPSASGGTVGPGGARPAGPPTNGVIAVTEVAVAAPPSPVWKGGWSRVTPKAPPSARDGRGQLAGRTACTWRRDSRWTGPLVGWGVCLKRKIVSAVTCHLSGGESPTLVCCEPSWMVSYSEV